MTLPQGKRQRRLILSDDDEPVVKTRRAPPRLSSASAKTGSGPKPVDGPKKARSEVATKASPKSSPEKANRWANKEQKENKSLHTFFGRVTEEQRWARKDKTPPIVFGNGEAEDAIEDDSLDEAFTNLPDGEEEENKVLDRRKAAEPTSQNRLFKAVSHVVVSSQKFAKPAKPATKGGNAVPGHDGDVFNRPWAERFSPASLEELAVHKKKVTDVQNWLSAVLQGRDRRVCGRRLRI